MQFNRILIKRYFIANANIESVSRILSFFYLKITQTLISGIAPVEHRYFYLTARDDVEPIMTLLSYGANLNICDFEGVTPLLMAISGGKKSVWKFLTLAGADVNVVDKTSGKTAMEWAKELGWKLDDPEGIPKKEESSSDSGSSSLSEDDTDDETDSEEEESFSDD